jgi:hypothetical protein
LLPVITTSEAAPKSGNVGALLTAMALELEIFQQRYGANSFSHRVALINLERYIWGFYFIALHGKPESKLVHDYTYHGSLKIDATSKISSAQGFSSLVQSGKLFH